MAQRSILAALFVSMLVVLNGCTTGRSLLTGNPAPGEASGEAAKRASAFQLFTDIPIPPGTSFDSENSLILGSGEGWTGRLIIKLSKAPPDAFAIYTTEMPQFGWRPVASIQSETSVLTFTRGNRAATIEIQARAITGSLVRITMTPQPTSNP